MGVRKIGKGRYLIDVRCKKDGKEFRFRRQVSGSLKAAREWEGNIKNALKYGDLLQEEKTRAILFKDFAWEWFETYVRANNKPGEQNSKETMLRVHLVPFFGNFYIQDITARNIDEYKAKMVASSYAPNTVNLHLSCLRKLFQCAIDWEILENNPISKVAKVKKGKDVWQFLDFEESNRFLAAVPEKWYPFFLTAIRTGMRQGELLALKWEDMDWKRNSIRVRASLRDGELGPTKTYSSREVFMTSDLFTCLLNYKEKSKSEYVFTTQNGRPINRKTLDYPLAKTIKESGVKKIRFHDLRHTYASHVAMAGVPMKEIQELLGHSTMTMTLRYAHLTPECKRQAVENLQNKILSFRGQKTATSKPEEEDLK